MSYMITRMIKYHFLRTMDTCCNEFKMNFTQNYKCQPSGTYFFIITQEKTLIFLSTTWLALTPVLQHQSTHCGKQANLTNADWNEWTFRFTWLSKCHTDLMYMIQLLLIQLSSVSVPSRHLPQQGAMCVLRYLTV